MGIREAASFVALLHALPSPGQLIHARAAVSRSTGGESRLRETLREILHLALLPFSLSSLDRAFFNNEVMDYTGASREAQHLCVLVHG